MCLNVCVFVVDLYLHIKIMLTCITPKYSLYLWPHMTYTLISHAINISLLLINSCFKVSAIYV